MNEKVIGYTLLRVVTGINMFMHGAVRLFGDYAGFAAGVASNFSGTVLPRALVSLVGWGIPPLEFVIGIGLVLGFLTRVTLIVGGILMGVLVFGMSLLQNWGTVANQMIYVLIFASLLFGLEYNRFSLDRKYSIG